MQSNFVEITFRHRCSPVNLLHIFRTLFKRTPLESWFWMKFENIILSPHFRMILAIYESFYVKAGLALVSSIDQTRSVMTWSDVILDRKAFLQFLFLLPQINRTHKRPSVNTFKRLLWVLVSSYHFPSMEYPNWWDVAK